MTNNETLCILLKNWFLDHIDEPRSWRDNRIGELIKRELTKAKHWKNHSRGRSKRYYN